MNRSKHTFYRHWRLALIAVGAIALATAIHFAVNTARESEARVEVNDRIGITPEQIQSIKAIGEWEFLSVATEEMVDTVRRGIFTDDHLVRIYYGTLRLGINLNHVAGDWIKAQGDSVFMQLPPIELLDSDFIDEARTQSFYESGRWTPADREALYQRAKQRMRATALTETNLGNARDHADAQFRQLLRAMGFSHIIIRFGR